jgi:hypothetical protein
VADLLEMKVELRNGSKLRKLSLPTGRPLVNCVERMFRVGDLMAWVYLLGRGNNELLELPSDLLWSLGGKEEVVTMYGLLRLILYQVKNGQLSFRRTKLVRFRPWGGGGNMEECFVTTTQLNQVTRLVAGTVRELSKIAVAAPEKRDWRGQGIWTTPVKWGPIFQMPMILEEQIPALIARHLREAKREREGLL